MKAGFTIYSNSLGGNDQVVSVGLEGFPHGEIVKTEPNAFAKLHERMERAKLNQSRPQPCGRGRSVADHLRFRFQELQTGCLKVVGPITEAVDAHSSALFVTVKLTHTHVPLTWNSL